MPTPDTPAQPPRRLLIVHGEGGIRFAVADYFRHRGFEVDEAEAPETGWNQLGLSRYDVMLTDYHFGRRAGEGLTLAARARLLSPRPVVCLFAPPLEPEEALLASRTVDLLITRPRPLADVAQMLYALLQSPAAETLSSTPRG